MLPGMIRTPEIVNALASVTESAYLQHARELDGAATILTNIVREKFMKHSRSQLLSLASF